MASTSAQHQPTSTDTMRKKPLVTYGSSQNTKRPAGDISSVGRDPRIRFLCLNNTDGTEVWHDGVNGPTPDMLDQSPDENGAQCYMKPVESKDKKMFEWLKQLAEAVVKDSEDVQMKQDLAEGKIKLFFTELPKGYRLYEQIRVPVCLFAFPVDRDTHFNPGPWWWKTSSRHLSVWPSQRTAQTVSFAHGLCSSRQVAEFRQNQEPGKLWMQCVQRRAAARSFSPGHAHACTHGPAASHARGHKDRPRRCPRNRWSRCALPAYNDQAASRACHRSRTSGYTITGPCAYAIIFSSSHSAAAVVTGSLPPGKRDKCRTRA
jgi:hypothetical protein